MKIFVNRVINAPWYPLAIAVYPALALTAMNQGQMQLTEGVRPTVISLLFGAVLYFAVWRFMSKRLDSAALFTSLFLMLFFAYGHVYIYLGELFPSSGYALWLPVLWISLVGFLIYAGVRQKNDLVSFTAPLNIMSFALIAMFALQLKPAQSVPAGAIGAQNAPIADRLSKPETPPDVYYFLLDSYGREDVLKDAYGYDNSGFIKALEERGFYVAGCSQSNYNRTEVSLGSTLNMSYLPELDPDFRTGNEDATKLWDSIKHSAVRYNFDSMGYQFVTFSSGFPWLEITDADLYLIPPSFAPGMNDFENLFLQTTLARYLLDWEWVDIDAQFGQAYRDRFNVVFDGIPELAKMEGAQFNYFHVISPHPPFVFDPEGNPTHPADFWDDLGNYPPDQYQRGYLNQLPYLNKKMLEAVDTILAESESPPIIIIQGDHGPWFQPDVSGSLILNAYYLPGHQDMLYPTISPVNTYRLIFNHYFDAEYDLLEDRSYLSPDPNLFDFEELPYSCP